MKLIDIDKRQRIDAFKQFMRDDLTCMEIKQLITELKNEFFKQKKRT